MFERFTDRARRVTVLSSEEARSLGVAYIGTEHVLLGLLSEGESIAYRVLTEHGFHHGPIVEALAANIPPDLPRPSGHIPFTVRSKKLFELSLREALQLGHNYIAPEHMLLGLIRLGEGAAVELLVKRESLAVLRQSVIRHLTDAQPKPRVTVRPSQPVGPSRQAAIDSLGYVIDQTRSVLHPDLMQHLIGVLMHLANPPLAGDERGEK